jgi:hypothetical protein
MIRRFVMRDWLYDSRATWPETPRRDLGAPFASRPTFRRLRALVDDDLINPVGPNEISQASLLAGLLSHQFVTIYRHADNGPPANVATTHFEHVGDIPAGWATSTDSADGLRHEFRYSDGETLNFGSFVEENARWIAKDTSTRAYTNLSHEVSDERRYRDAVAACIAREMGVDLYITGRAHLLTTTRMRDTSIVNLVDGLALVSLYLRAQGVFWVWADPLGKWIYHTNKGMFYWVGARELLPAGWRWVTACSQHSQHTGVEKWREIATSAIERVQRALEYRDHLHTAMNQPASNDTGDNAVSAFEVAAMLLMSAVDLTAIVAHHAVGLTTVERYASWQNTGWLGQIATKSSTLAAVVAQGTMAKDTLTALQDIRNSIHGVALEDVIVRRTGGKPTGIMIRLPKGRNARLLGVMRNLASDKSWGLEDWGEDYLADPGMTLDALFPLVVNLLNDLMRETPVDKLPGVSLQPADLLPPASGPVSNADPFSERWRFSIRWQLGFGTPS